MVGTSSTNESKPKRRRRRQKGSDELVSYEIQVADWDFYYNFRVSDPKSRFDRGPFSELSTLTLNGNMVAPGNIKYELGKLTLSARSGMMTERYTENPQNIGTLSVEGGVLTAYVFVPAERLAELTALVSSGKIKIACISGSKLRYRSGFARSISIRTNVEDED